MVKGLADALGLEKFHLAVHDVGGIYDLAFTARHAARLLSLTIFNVGFFSDFKWHTLGKIWRTPVLGEIAMAAMKKGAWIEAMKKNAPKLPRPIVVHGFDQYSKTARRQVLHYYRSHHPSVFKGWEDELTTVMPTLNAQVI